MNLITRNQFSEFTQQVKALDPHTVARFLLSLPMYILGRIPIRSSNKVVFKRVNPWETDEAKCLLSLVESPETFKKYLEILLKLNERNIRLFDVQLARYVDTMHPELKKWYENEKGSTWEKFIEELAPLVADEKKHPMIRNFLRIYEYYFIHKDSFPEQTSQEILDEIDRD